MSAERSPRSVDTSDQPGGRKRPRNQEGDPPPRPALRGWQIALLFLALLPAIAAGLLFTQLGGIYELIPDTCPGEDCGRLANAMTLVNGVAQAAIVSGALLLSTRRRTAFGARLAMIALGAPAMSLAAWITFGQVARLI